MNENKKSIILTLKKTLVSSKLPPVISYEQLKTGDIIEELLTASWTRESLLIFTTKSA